MRILYWIRGPNKAKRGQSCLTGFCLYVYFTSGILALAQKSSHTRIISNVELVQVPLIVFDEKGSVAINLKKTDFRLIDDGVVQQILHLDRVRRPVSFVILADLSDSMTSKIPFVQEAAFSLLDPMDEQCQSCDEYSVVAVATRAHRLIDFTRDQEDLSRRFPFLLTAMYGRTSLFDGIYLGATVANQDAANQRRAMVIISDGGDNNSRYNLYETEHLLEEADLPVFAIMAGPAYEPLFHRADKQRAKGVPWPNLPGFLMAGPEVEYIGPAERQGPHNLRVLTQGTGGGVFTAKTVDDIWRIVRTIGMAVRYQYVLTYEPLHEAAVETKRSKSPDKNNRHKIHIELYPQEDFRGYSVPYYRDSYTDPEQF